MARIKHYNATTQKWEYSDISSAIKGETGATGATGATPNLTIGTVSTLPAGSNATAEIIGNDEKNPILNLGIPRGADGEADGAVMYATSQSLTEAQKTQARNNIGAISASEVMADVFATGTTAPANTKLLWISPDGLQYYNGSAWTPVPVAYT